ncbi:3-deoxy-D-manno-octulosonic acid kinase [Salinicola endophyticus]|uniref:3-deoxy-D-manno-octulosonic acid kinase n=1 Tax=Salinicola endophyticus TaxID=1949083 RepID=A0ABY8FMJ6_9GAMM|nr:3-deoxy-D-manno-octulosonic acid kinase [Salinicola endophyticus]WFF41109.1 3-deoxy-D-manno-octulosonic acid kinase [Salinicola endophyticus]
MALSTYHHRGTHILYDPAYLAQPDHALLPAPGPAWLNPAAWQAKGLVVGSAPGRGASQFLQVEDQAWVLRPYRRGGMVARVNEQRYLWQGLERTRAFREMRLTLALYERGLPVPAPVAALVCRQGPTYRAALLTQRLAHSRALADCLDPDATALLHDVGRVIRRFHDVGLDHVDLNARNLLISTDPASGRDKVWMIDFDRCRLRPAGAWQQRNLARLERSLTRFSTANASALFAAICDGYHGADAPDQG